VKSKTAELKTKQLLEAFDERRRELGLSHQTVADRAGIARSTVSLVMRQKTTPTITMCFKIASALDIELRDIV
jgi:DNA-binding XRE family transcriptional regulator